MAQNPSATAGDPSEHAGIELLARLASTPAPIYLTPSPDLARLARDASSNLFSALLPFSPKALPFESLLVDERFDAEQIWHQIDLQSRPVTRSVRRGLRSFEGMGKEEVRALFGVKSGGFDEEMENEESGDEEEEEEEEEAGDEDEEMEEDEEEEEEEEEEDGKEGALEERGGLEDGFFNTKELEEFMEKEEEKEYGGKKKGEDEEGEDEDESDDLDAEDGAVEAEYARFEDFFGRKKTMPSSKGEKKNKKSIMKAMDMDEMGSDDQIENSSEDFEELDAKNNETSDIQNVEKLSTFEKQKTKIQMEIEQIEKELVAPKSWTMQGEVTGSKRPKDGALEVNLDFEHNRRRPMLPTEENTASVEELIINRIREGHLDEVQRPTTLPSKEPKVLKELDENKSKKGLAEVYEEEYAQKTGLGTAPPSLPDEQKKEAQLLFKKICLKLDALSHFHFTPKPVIEDMSVEANIPALAVEEIAPLAVSDAAMLAPEEIFSGKGDIKEDAELTQEDRKRRRAKKKRRLKAQSEKFAAKKARESKLKSDVDGDAP